MLFRMADPSPRMTELFFEVFEPLPRQGPGNRSSAERALALCDGLPGAPRILDLGCGVGGQSLQLIEMTGGSVVAVDNHPPNVARLRQTAAERGLEDRIEPWLGDMAAPDQPARSFDLIWSEGALYNIGIPKALEVCQGLLRPGGHLAFTEAVWLSDDRPAQVREAFADYAAMGTARDVVRCLASSPFTLRGHFTLPREAWWDDFYTPMERRIAELRERYAEDAEALACLDQLAVEPEMHRRHGDCYGYEFFVSRL